MSLESQALSRKERLAKLRGIKTKSKDSTSSSQNNDQEGNQNQNENEDEGFKLVSKNYDPETRAPRIGFDVPPTAQLGAGETVELASKQLEQETLAKLKQRGIASNNNNTSGNGPGLDLASLQPKRANWDLKRDIEQQMELLETQTHNAIARIVRDRLKAEVKKENM